MSKGGVTMRHLVFTDLHGNLTCWRAIEAEIRPGDEVFCLGDCIDRGPDGYQILNEVLAHPQITFIRGNHEDLWAHLFLDEVYVDPEGFFSKVSRHDDLESWVEYNGGSPTLRAWEDDGAPYEILERILATPVRYDLETDKGHIVLSHAGFTPGKVFKFPQDYVWNRYHIRQKWPKNDGVSDLDRLYIVHGHTPLQALDYFYSVKTPIVMNKPYFYCEGHKINLDLGTFLDADEGGGYALLFNLDDFSYKLVP